MEVGWVKFIGVRAGEQVVGSCGKFFCTLIKLKAHCAEIAK